jgi:hypothetical protein
MIENSWFYYFSTLAQTIASASALLVALAVIKLQFLSSALHDVQQLIAEVFFKIAKSDDYISQVSSSILSENWEVYFQQVRQLVYSNKDCFSYSGDYKTSKAFADSLIMQGSLLNLSKGRLHRALVYAFGGTVLFSGTSILAIPIAQWITSGILLYVWIGSGTLLMILLILYMRLITSTVEAKYWKKLV